MRISDWSSDVCSSDLELLGHDRPDWELSAARLARVIREVPEAFAPKHRWAMDWYYPVLGGVVLGDAGRARLEERRDTFVMEDRGVRCVSDRPRSEEPTSALQSLMRNWYFVLCLQEKH